MLKVLRLAAALYLLSNFLPAQETRSTISGHVYDQQSAHIVGAKVTVMNTDTGSVTQLVTNDTGFFEAPLLVPGQYKVSATAPGFKTSLRDNIVLQISQTLSVDLKLDIGTVNETIEVTAAAPVLDSNALESGALIDNEQ